MVRFALSIEFRVFVQRRSVGSRVFNILDHTPLPLLSEPAIRDAIRTDFQFNVIHPTSGNKIDSILPKKGDWPWAKMSRGRPVRGLPDRDVMTAASEDVILGKLW